MLKYYYSLFSKLEKYSLKLAFPKIYLVKENLNLKKLKLVKWFKKNSTKN